MKLWLVILAAGVITFVFRLSFIQLAGSRNFAPWFKRSVGPAVLAGIVAPGLAAPAGSIDLTLANPRLIAGLLALAIAWRTRDVTVTVAGGMAILWLLVWLR